MNGGEDREVIKRLEQLQRQVEELAGEQEKVVAHRVFKSAQSSIKAWIAVWIGAITLAMTMLGIEGYRQFISLVTNKASEYVRESAIPKVEGQLKAGSLAAFAELDTEFSGLRERAEYRFEELEKQIKALGQRAAVKLEDPQFQTIATSTAGRPEVPETGYAYYGLHLKNDRWETRYFRIKGDEPKARPQSGDQVVAESNVNVRSGYIEYSLLRGWTNKPIIGAIRPGDTLRVEESRDVTGGHIWIKFRSADGSN